uniref:VWFD domain-containing protein n=1 Tax=Amphimedon queenslandica TaxID=400682 RepID=A0A1X7VGN5_AMPQE
MAATTSLLWVVVVLSTTLFEPYVANPLYRRGLPLPPDHATSASHYGNRFSISFPSSTYDASYYIHLIPELPTPIELIINITDSLSLLWPLNGSLIGRSISRLNLTSNHAVVLPTDSAVDRNILIYSSNPNQTFSVTGVAKSDHFTSTFLALPPIAHNFIKRYQYTQFSLPIEDTTNNDYSMFLLSDVFNRVAPFSLAPPNLEEKVQIRDVYQLFANPQRTIQGFPTPFRSLRPDDTFHFESSTVDMTGITVWGEEPFNFIASQVCNINPTNRNCRQVIEQIPPSHTWGYLFHIMPFEDPPNPGYLIRIRPLYHNSSVTYNCHDDIEDSTDFSLEGLDIDIKSQTPCVITAEQPIAVMQYFIDEDIALMVWVAPVSQYQQVSAFYVPSFGPDFKHYITVTVNERCFNSSLILIDGLPIDSDSNSWTPLYCSNASSDACGYGYSTNVSSRDRRYTVEHVDEICAVNIISYGWSSSSGYAHSCGYKMEPIGIPILSIDHGEYNGDEGDNITISLTRRGHILTDLTVRYELRTLTDIPGLNISESFRRTNGQITISSNTTNFNLVLHGIDNRIAEAERLYIKSFILHLFPIDGDDVYMPYNTTIIRIKDDDILTIGFEVPTVTVTEGDTGLNFILRSRAGIIDGGTGISVTLTTINGTALVNEDYERINDGTLRPGRSQWSLPYTIRSDSIVEPVEYFTVSLGLRLVRPRPNVRLGLNRLNVTIIDDDRVFFRFGQANYSLPENNGSVVVTVNMGGTTRIPLKVSIETFDITAYANTDYMPLSRTELTFLNQSSMRVTLLILDDMFLEGNEVFGVSLTSTDPRVNFAAPRIANVIIQNDDSVSIGFNVSNVEVSENDAFANINIVIDGTVSYRDFYIHFETLQDSAVAGSDFIPISNDILFPANTTVITISIRIINDSITEQASESFTAIVRGADRDLSFVKVSSINQIPVAINDDDSVSDYIIILERVDFSSSSPIASFPVIINDDDIVEEQIESFVVSISSRLSLSGIIINRNSTRINIRDDDVLTVSFNSSSYSANESDSVVNVYVDVFGLSELSLQPFFMTINNGTARAGFDYIPVSRALSLTNNQVIVPITLTLDQALENRESFTVSLTSNSSSLVVNRSRAVVYIEDTSSTLFFITSGANTRFNEYEDVIVSYEFPGEFEKSIFFNVIVVDINTTNGDYRDGFQTIEKLPNERKKDVRIRIINDELVEGPETFTVFTTTAERRLSFIGSPLNITIIDDDREVSSICTIQSSSIVYPFPSPDLSYRYRSSCEHIVLKRCGLTSPYLLTAVYDDSDLDKIGFQVTDKTIVIFKNLSLISENLGDPIRLGIGLVEYRTIDLIVNISRTDVNILLNETGLLINVHINETNGIVLTVTDLGGGETTCGLCGSLNGTLYLSNGVDRLVLNGSTVGGRMVDDFVQSWVVNPQERLSTSGDVKPECGLLVNDSITADPLFRLPLPPFSHSSPSRYLCYEILGQRGDTFNLVSDRCLSVSALYVPMNHPTDGNVIGAIGIKTVDNNGSCISVSISHESDSSCSLTVNGVSRTRYDEGAGVVMTTDGGRVLVSAANCEKEGVVMWVKCGLVDGQRMIDFVISRGANLRQTSHGLLGQFWNTPITIAPYTIQLTQSLLEDFDQTQLYTIQVSPVGGTSRQFIGELYQRSWDRSFRPCLYVGSSQGGKLKDIPGPSDSVIEGSYIDYLVPGLLATDFKFSRFKNSFCPSN